MSAFTVPFDLPFDAAIAHARARGVVLPAEYYAMAAEKRAQAFTVSNLAKLDQVQAVADQLAKIHTQGGTFADFQRWAKTQDWSLPRHRLETIYRNAAQTAYMAGHWRSFEESKDALPYLMYDAINDSRTRPSHLALDGVIKPVGDAFWKSHACPNGHRCRCSIRALSREEAQRRGGVTQHVPAEGGADAGWGQDPREWTSTLRRLIQDRQSACLVDAAQFGRKQRPVAQNMDCTEWGAKMLADMENLTPAKMFALNTVKYPREKQPSLRLTDVSESAVEKANALGIALDGKVLALDHDGVRHAFKEHGGDSEYTRGQEPITADDVANWERIFNTAVLRVGQPPMARDGTVLIAGTAYLNGWKYDFAAKVRRRDIVLQTLFKRQEK